MRKENVIKLNIDDEIYNYQSFKGVFTYKIIGVREYKNNYLYEIECQECKNHPNCKILVSQIDNLPQFKYISMVDEDEDNEQYYWHSEQPYFISKNDCKKFAYQKVLENRNKDIEKLEKQLKEQKKRVAEIKSLIEDAASNIN